MPTERPTRWPAPKSASDQAMLYPLARRRRREERRRFPRPITRAAMIASPAEATAPSTTAVRPSRASAGSVLRVAASARTHLQDFSGRHALRVRQGRVRDQRAPQRNREQHAQDAAADADQERLQNGNPVHQPTMTRPGSTKMIAESVPAADATVCTMLFSRIDESLTALRIAIEMTAAGIDEAKVRPTFRPRYTLAAVKTVVMSAPSPQWGETKNSPNP